MRIVKDRAASVLSNEITKLSQQAGRCEYQVSKLAHASFDGLLAKSADIAQNNTRMQAAIATAHLQFYRALAQADKQNAQLVAALPTTSPGVLDTSVAQERATSARDAMKSLAAKRDEAVEQARLANEALALSGGDVVGASVRLDLLRQNYDALIQGQRVIAQINEDIIQRAQQYEQDAAGVYRGVDASFLSSAAASANEYVQTGSWGNVAWVNTMNLGLGLAALEREHVRVEEQRQRQWESFLAGELGAQGSAADGSVEGTYEVYGVTVTGRAEGDVLDAELTLAPQDATSVDLVGDGSGIGAGIEVGAEAHAAQGSISGDVGDFVHGEAHGEFYTMAASASAGVSLYDEETLAPSVNAGYELSLSLLSHEEEVRVGTEDFNVHSQSSATVLGAESSAELMFGEEGIGVSVGDEAYVAQGSIGSGITFMGVSFDFAVTAKVGGAGVEAGAKVTPGYAQGNIGLGIGVGLGLEVKVDWSGAAAAAERTWQGVTTWWDSLW